MDFTVIVAAILALTAQTSGDWKLKDGTKVYLYFLLGEQKKVWRPNGVSVDPAFISKNLDNGYPSESPVSTAVVLLHTQFKTEDKPNVRFVFSRPSKVDTFFSTCKATGRLWVLADDVKNTEGPQGDVTIGVANGQWKVAGWVSYDTSNTGIRVAKTEGIRFNPQVIAPIRGPKTSLPTTDVKIFLSKNYENVAYRIIATDRKGNEIALTSTYFKNEEWMKYGFTGDIHNIARVELQTRPFEWHTIPDAHFVPN